MWSLLRENESAISMMGLERECGNGWGGTSLCHLQMKPFRSEWDRTTQRNMEKNDGERYIRSG